MFEQTFMTFFAGFLVGMPFGIFIAATFQKNKINFIKALNVFLFFIWIFIHVYGFFNDLQVPWIFDIVGGLAVGHLLGFDVSSIISRFKK